MNSYVFPSVRELLDSRAQSDGNAVFLKYLRNGSIQQKSFAEVRSDSLAFCRMIRRITADGAHIALLGDTGYEYLIGLTGILISGCVTVPFSPALSAQEAESLFQQADIDMVVYDADFAAAEDLQARCPDLQFLNLSAPGAFDDILRTYDDSSEYAPLSDYAVDKDACAAIIFTSGTTGIRKGVMLSTNALVGNIMYHDLCTDVFRENDVSLCVLPMHHVYCFSGDFIKNLKDGLQVCLNGNMRDLLPNLQTFEPRVIRVVPLIAETLLRRVNLIAARNPSLTPREAAEKIFGRNIRHLISGGAYLDPHLIEAYEAYGIHLRQGYGMTEAGCRISVPDDTMDPASVGRVLDICDVRIQNGEIQVKTPTVMLGYYKMPRETEEMFTPDGWLKTGDIGYVTDDRQLFITGRVKNLIILSNGENVSPEAIEQKYADFPLVKEVMVYAEADRIVAACYPDEAVAARQKISDIPAAIQAYTDKLNSVAKSSHYIAKTVIRSEPFEKTESGKLKRKDIRI